MAKIDFVIENQTLAKVDEALERAQLLEKPRNYMGMSMIGDECWRKVFYDFRNVKKRIIKAFGIKAIQDGFVQEDIMIKRLRMLPFIELHTEDPDRQGQQIGFSSLLDHLRGHADGIIKGIVEAPLTWHVWENKAVNEKKWQKLNDLKVEKGEKNALEEWDATYYAQAQLYMHFAELDRHYITVQTPGGRNYTSARTEYNKKKAEALIEKAKTLIFDNFSLPARLSDNREFYKCKWCDFSGVCHDGDIPDVNCKTCRYREPIKDGKSQCLLMDTIIEDSMLNIGCKNHIFNPALISAQLIDQQDYGCLYKLPNGIFFSNNSLIGFPTDHPALNGQTLEIFTSKELKEKIKNVNNITNETMKIVKTFDGQIMKEGTVKAWNWGGKADV